MKTVLLARPILVGLIVGTLAGAGLSADPPTAGNQSAKPAADAKKRDEAQAELRRLAKESGPLAKAGNVVEAITAGQRAVELAREIHGKSSDTVASWQDWLASQYEKQANWPAARKTRQDALAVRVAIYGDKNWRVVDKRLELANIEILARLTADEKRKLAEAQQQLVQVRDFDRKEQDAKALPLARQAYETRRKLLGSEHPDTLTSCGWLGTVCRGVGNYAEAESLHRQTLESRKKVLGEDHPDTALIYDNLGDLYRATSQYTKAEEPLRRALEIRKKILGDDRDTAVSYSKLARLYQARSEFAKAEPLDQQALAIYKKVRGENDLETATALNNLATLYATMGKNARAEPLYREALQVRRKVLGEKNSQIVQSLTNLGLLYEAMREYAKAEPLLQQAFEIDTSLLGETRAETAASANNLAYLYESQSQYTKAEPLYQRALEIRRKVLGPKHPDTASSLNVLGMLYQSMGDNAKAEPLLEQALDIRLAVLGELHKATAQSLNNLALLYLTLDEYVKAETLLKRSLAVWQKVRGRYDRNTAACLNNLAELYCEKGDFAQSQSLYEEALAIQTKVLGRNHASTATTIRNLGGLYEAKGDFAKALESYRQALDIMQKVLGEKHRDTALSLSKLGSLYHLMGDYAPAERLLRQAVDIDKQVLGESHPDTASCLNGLGLLYVSMGEYAKAEAIDRQALAIREKSFGEKSSATATSLNNLANLYDSLGDLPKAEPLYQQAIAIDRQVFGEEHRATALGLDNLAVLYKEAGNNAKAEPLFRKALAIRRKVLGEKHPYTALSLQHLASVLASKGAYKEAESLDLQAIAIRKNVSGEKQPDTAMALNNLAFLYHMRGDFAKAEPLYREAIEILKAALGDQHPDTAAGLANLGYLYRSMGEPAKAEPLCRQALEISQNVLDRAYGGIAERQQLNFSASLQFKLHSYLSLAESLPISDATLYGYVLKGKGSVTARQWLIRVERRRPELKKRFDELETVSTRLANLALAGSDLKNAVERSAEIKRLTERKESLEEQLEAQSTDFAAIRENDRLTPAQLLEKVKSALPDKTALVNFLEYRHGGPSTANKLRIKFEWRLAAFVVKHDGSGAGVKRVELGPSCVVNEAIENWRRDAVQPDRPRTNGSEWLEKLKTLVWDKLEPHLAGAETILVSPDAALCRFPFGVLPGSKPDTYLVEERTFVVVPVPRLLPQIVKLSPEHGSAEPESLLLVGDVEYGGSPGRADQVASRSAPRSQSLHAFRKLDHSAAEVAAIQLAFQRHFKRSPVDLLLGEDATESSFRQQAPAHRWLHLATHGFYDPPGVRASGTAGAKAGSAISGQRDSASQFDPGDTGGYHPGLLSGLALAGANCQTVKPGEDDGILTALEVSSLDLSGVELAVLSACETGLGSTMGDVARGEGLLGLQRAFQVAGAKSVMAGLWRVPDRETMLLMQRFYQNVWTKKLPKAQALREAQIWMLKEAKPPRGLDTGEEETPASKKLLPKYWAGFVLSGDWR